MAGGLQYMAGRLRVPRPTGGQLLAVAGLVALLCAGTAFIPQPAHALDLNPLPSVEEIVAHMVQELFGIDEEDAEDSFNAKFIEWLISVPNFVGNPDNGQLDSNLEELGQTTTGIAFGLLGAVMTFAVLHHWLSGLSQLSGDGTQLLEGITKSVGMALLILAWPWIFVNGAAVSNAVTAVLVNGQDLDKIAGAIMAGLLIAIAVSGGLGLIIGIILALAAAVMLLALAAMKIVMSAALAVLFAGMPLALVLMPLPAFSWIPRLMIRAVITLMFIPIIWALCMATFLAVGFDSLEWNGGGIFKETVLEPLTALALLWLMITLPRSLIRVASLGAALPGSGPVGSMVSYVGGRFAYDAVSSRVGSMRGGQGGPQQQTQRRPGSPDDGGNGGGRTARPADPEGAMEAARDAGGTGMAGSTGGGGGAGAGTAGQAGEKTAGGSNATGKTTGSARGMPSGATVEWQNEKKGWRNAAGTFHDMNYNLPSNPGSDEIGRARQDVNTRSGELEGEGQEKQAERERVGHKALDDLSQAGYADATMEYTEAKSPHQTAYRMADASSSDGLSTKTSGAFINWGALDADTRQTVMDEYRAAGNSGGGGGGDSGGGDSGGEPAVQPSGSAPEPAKWPDPGHSAGPRISRLALDGPDGDSAHVHRLDVDGQPPPSQEP